MAAAAGFRREALAGTAGAEAAAGDVEQAGGVVGRARAQLEHAVVAGVLALVAHRPRGGPDERVGPVEGAGKTGDELRHRIVALDVRQLVDQDRALLRGGPA